MTLSNDIKLLQKCTSVFGLAPFSTSKNTSINIKLYLLQLIYTCFLSIPWVYQCFKLYLIASANKKPDISEFISILEVLFLSINTFLAWFYSLIFYKDLLIILSAFYRLEELFSLLDGYIPYDQDETIRLAQIIFLISFTVILNVLEYLENGFNWGYIIDLPITLGVIYQFLNFITYINYSFMSLNNYLCKYGSNTHSLKAVYPNVFINNFHRHVFDDNSFQSTGIYSKWRKHKVTNINKQMVPTNDILVAREIHRFMYTLSKEINNFFSVQILFFLIFKIISITIVLYYLLSSTKPEDLKLDHTDFWITRLNKAILGINNFLQLIAIAFVCTSTSEEANFTGVLVHGLLNTDLHQELKRDLQIFSQQILHQRIIFTASGFVILDFTLINSVIGAVTTYLVILIQFQMST